MIPQELVSRHKARVMCQPMIIATEIMAMAVPQSRCRAILLAKHLVTVSHLPAGRSNRPVTDLTIMIIIMVEVTLQGVETTMVEAITATGARITKSG
jgi:hypothetical protein